MTLSGRLVFSLWQRRRVFLFSSSLTLVWLFFSNVQPSVGGFISSTHRLLSSRTGFFFYLPDVGFDGPTGALLPSFFTEFFTEFLLLARLAHGTRSPHRVEPSRPPPIGGRRLPMTSFWPGDQWQGRRAFYRHSSPADAPQRKRRSAKTRYDRKQNSVTDGGVALWRRRRRRRSLERPVVGRWPPVAVRSRPPKGLRPLVRSSGSAPLPFSSSTSAWLFFFSFSCACRLCFFLFSAFLFCVRRLLTACGPERLVPRLVRCAQVPWWRNARRRSTAPTASPRTSAPKTKYVSLSLGHWRFLIGPSSTNQNLGLFGLPVNQSGVSVSAIDSISATFTGFYRVLPGFTGFYWVLLGLTW